MLFLSTFEIGRLLKKLIYFSKLLSERVAHLSIIMNSVLLKRCICLSRWQSRRMFIIGSSPGFLKVDFVMLIISASIFC
jgi:hypothetical protein